MSQERLLSPHQPSHRNTTTVTPAPAQTIDAELVAEFARRLDVVFVHMHQSFPFWSSLLWRCTIRLAPDQVAPTAFVTRSGTIVIGLSFLRSLSNAQLVFVLAHEVAHLAFRHFERQGSRDRLLWNMAADYAINPMLVRDLAAHIEPCDFEVDGMLMDPVFRNKTCEEIYAALECDATRRKECGQAAGTPEDHEFGCDESEDDVAGCGKPGCDGAGKDGENGPPRAQELGPCDLCESDAVPEGSVVLRDALDPTPQSPQEWQEAEQAAVSFAKERGNIPGNRLRKAVANDYSRVNWTHVLRACARRSLRGVNRPRFSLLPPNRRHVHRGAYLPSMRATPIKSPRLAVVVDTSGSIGASALQMMATEIQALRAYTKCHIYLIECDSMVQKARWLSPKESLPTAFRGGGGTSFAPPFDHLSKEAIVPDALIYITDGDGQFGKPPQFDVIWLMTTNAHAPFGQVVRFRQ